MTTTEHDIFARGSKTYFNAARFLPQAIKQDVFELYSFVRTADDYVDTIPQSIAAFQELVGLWRHYRTLPVSQLRPAADDSPNIQVTKNICRVSTKHHFEPEWVDVFLRSMQWDIEGRHYQTLNDSLAYVYGSAEVIGFMMAKIIGVSVEGMAAAAAQGRAMQWINFVRDIAEDQQLGRQYFPQTDLQECKLKDLSSQTAKAKPGSFTTFIELQLQRYAQWQRQAEAGFSFIPRRSRIAVQAATDGYAWTAQQIARDPLVVYQHQVKPSRSRILVSVIGHIFD